MSNALLLSTQRVDANGRGTLSFPNGTVGYEGDLLNGLPHGQGIVYTQSGVMRYTGAFVSGKRHGRGKLYAPDRTVLYCGQWKNNLWHGLGTAYFADGNPKYKGGFARGKFHGFGVLYDALTGLARYQGDFRSSHRHGYGAQYDRNGALICSGVWENDVFVRATARDDDVVLTTRRDALTKDAEPTQATKRTREEAVGSATGTEHVPKKRHSDVGPPVCISCFTDLDHGIVSYAYVPCGHRVLCAACASSVPDRWTHQCMMCRAEDVSLIRIF